VEGGLTAKQRKRFFSRPQNLAKFTLQPGLIYTFDFYQHMLDITTMEINLGFRKFDISDFLNNQPVQAMARLFDREEYFWNIEIWHPKLLPPWLLQRRGRRRLPSPGAAEAR